MWMADQKQKQQQQQWSVTRDAAFIPGRWQREFELQEKRLSPVAARMKGYANMMAFVAQQTLLSREAQRKDSDSVIIRFNGDTLTYNDEIELKLSESSKPLAVMFYFSDEWAPSQRNRSAFEDACKLVAELCRGKLKRMRSLTLKGFGAETWLQIVMNSDIALRRLDLSPCYPNTFLMVRWLTLHFPEMECVHLNLFPCQSEIFQESELKLVTAGRHVQIMDLESADNVERSISQLAFHFADFSGVTHHIRFLELHFATSLPSNAHFNFFSAPTLEHMGLRHVSQLHTRERGYGWDYAALTNPILQHVEVDNHNGVAGSTYSVFWSRTHRYAKGCDLFIRGQEPYQEPPCLLSEVNREQVRKNEEERRGKDIWNWEPPQTAKNDSRQNAAL